MARRIISADSALAPPPQVSLAMGPQPPRDSRSQLLAELQQRWAVPPAPLDGRRRAELMDEIAWVNRAQALLDEAAIKIAPSVLRIVLAVRESLPDPAAQRSFLAEHLQLDFRRVSELCIVAESYGLLDPALRDPGAREIERYGWSNALKLAQVRDGHDRRHLWERACAGRPKAAFRDVLEQLSRYRERRQLGPATHAEAEQGSSLRRHLDSATDQFAALTALGSRFKAPDRMAQDELQRALRAVQRLKRELGRLQRALQQRVELAEHAVLAGENRLAGEK